VGDRYVMRILAKGRRDIGPFAEFDKSEGAALVKLANAEGKEAKN